MSDVAENIEAAVAKIKSEIKKANNKISKYNSEIASIRDDLDELKKVKDKLTQLDNDCQTIRKNLKKRMKQKGEWSGNTQNLFCNTRGDWAVEKVDEAKKTVNNALDELNDIIESYESKIYDKMGVIGSLNKVVSNGWNEIDKLLNDVI